jgi:hypothetical protein
MPLPEAVASPPKPFLEEPLLYLSLYFKTHRQRYYDLGQLVRTAWVRGQASLRTPATRPAAPSDRNLQARGLGSPRSTYAVVGRLPRREAVFVQRVPEETIGAPVWTHLLRLIIGDPPRHPNAGKTHGESVAEQDSSQLFGRDHGAPPRNPFGLTVCVRKGQDMLSTSILAIRKLHISETNLDALSLGDHVA